MEGLDKKFAEGLITNGPKLSFSGNLDSPCNFCSMVHWHIVHLFSAYM